MGTVSLDEKNEEAWIEKVAEVEGINCRQAKASMEDAPQLDDMRAESKRILLEIQSEKLSQSFWGVVASSFIRMVRAR